MSTFPLCPWSMDLCFLFYFIFLLNHRDVDDVLSVVSVNDTSGELITGVVDSGYETDCGEQ
jgi:hypothetical protein